MPAALRHRAELLALAAVLVAALAIRLPYLQSIPAFTDELDEVMRGVGMLRGEGVPLTNVTTYIGALFNYLVALGFAVFGPHVIIPRALVMLAGVATVGATYLLGRQAGGPLAGAVAAGLLATSGAHVLINSHIALSSSLTPLPVALSAWLVGRAVLERHGPSLAWAGLALGLALQTHPTVIAVLAGCGSYVLGRAPRLVLGRWGLLAAGAFLLGYANMVLYNATTGFESFTSALGASEDYQDGRLDEQPGYGMAITNILLASMRLLAGGIDRQLRFDAIVLSPLVVAYTAFAIVGLALAVRRGLWLWALIVAIWLLLLPAFNWKYGNLLLSRWINPIAPFCYAAIGLAIAALWQRAGRAPPHLELHLPGFRSRRRTSAARHWKPQTRDLKPGPRILVPLLALALILQPLGPLRQHYEEVARRGPTNDEPLRQATVIEAVRRPDELVIIDSTLQNYSLEISGSVSKALRYALTVRQVPLLRLAVTEERLADALAPYPSVLLATDRRRVQSLGGLFQIAAVEDPNRPGAPEYGVYRVSPRRPPGG
jgi:hypothetical protein